MAKDAKGHGSNAKEMADRRALLKTTQGLEKKFAKHSPGSARHGILMKDVGRQKAELASMKGVRSTTTNRKY